ncbi:MAG TPA: RteC domain-containing protein [Flavobacteriaceae bacterium]|nr:RteC domain-containing protein [Bacteroidota bacterium]HPF11182.1 RteC domain-containing protein [Flavobacteriaceae bacterium]HQU66319.1 RteC domain-containing protein [Flavobacteriaceae bacterium]HRW43699.1 RteC domain-containing protein [Flavobacteriaceae bacterium]
MKHLKKIIDDLNEELDVLEYESEDCLSKAEKGIRISKRVLIDIRNIVLENDFKEKDEEINFFKHIKPQAYSKLIYYIKLFTIESRKPRGSNKTQIKYFNLQIEKLQTYFQENLDFYHYYRRGATFLDKQYFLRGKTDIRLFPDNFHCLTDDQFSTSHDSSVATILAYDLLIVYLKREIDKLEDNGLHPAHLQLLQKNAKIVWTSQKVNLIELIYALHSTDVINNGAVEIKDIARVVERIFKVDLGDYYRAFLEIRMRKKVRTKFLDMLKENLMKRMDEIDC